VFQIRSEYDYYSGSAAGAGDDGGHSYTVSSEDDPTASSLSLSVESGYYYVRLLPGWRMEKVSGGSANDVEAQLLSSSTQWVWVGAHSTSWVEFQFGLGDRALWFNGDLNINIQVYEDPDQYYGTGNYGGQPSAGAGTGGSAGEAPQPQGEGGV